MIIDPHICTAHRSITSSGSCGCGRAASPKWCYSKAADMAERTNRPGGRLIHTHADSSSCALLGERRGEKEGRQPGVFTRSAARCSQRLWAARWYGTSQIKPGGVSEATVTKPAPTWMMEQPGRFSKEERSVHLTHLTVFFPFFPPSPINEPLEPTVTSRSPSLQQRTVKACRGGPDPR